MNIRKGSEVMFERIMQYINQYMPMTVKPTDIIEIIIISFAFYQIMVWIKNTRAWSLFKGIGVILIFTLIAVYFRMNTILWIADKTLSVGIIALIIVFQPELRKALEQIGKKNFISNIFSFTENRGVSQKFSDKTINELVKATYELAKTKTGALMVLEQDINLDEYIATGIEVDAVITSQLLINIFEHNTPLHDGAAVFRGDRVVSATCYLPLSDNMELSKELGTRHRAGVGISEVTDSFTIIVSEETGKVSVAQGGQLVRNIDGEHLRRLLIKLQNKTVDNKRFKLLRGKRGNNEEISHK